MAHWTLRRAGAQWVMALLSQHLRSAGHPVDFVTTVDRGLDAEEFAAYCDESWHFPDVGDVPVRIYLSRFREAILNRGYDALVTHHSHQGVAVAGTLPTSIATLSVIHEHPKQGLGYVGMSNPDAFDAYVGVSAGVTELVKGILGPSHRVQCVLNGVRCGTNVQRPQRNEFHGLFVGHLVEHKGVLLVPKILRKVRRSGIPLRITLVGDGPDHAKLIEEIRIQQVEPWIELVGNRPQSEVFSLMEEADILLMCSRHEGLGLVLPEAMSRGCVPIATDLKESTAEIVTSGSDGFLVQDLAGFADAITTLWNDPAMLTEMRSQAHRTATARFSDRRMAEEYDHLLSELIALPRDRKRIQNCPSYC